jgi:hypothetical protein
MSKTNIYLDIDGVLLANDLNPANFANDFLRKVLTFWLTTHCNGDPNVPIQHIGHLFDDDVQELMKLIKPTTWETAKTRGIDFTAPFLWFDDDLFFEEKQELEKYGVLENWLEVNLAKNENQLQDFLVSFPLPFQIQNLEGANHVSGI